MDERPDTDNTSVDEGDVRKGGVGRKPQTPPPPPPEPQGGSNNESDQ